MIYLFLFLLLINNPLHGKSFSIFNTTKRIDKLSMFEDVGYGLKLSKLTVNSLKLKNKSDNLHFLTKLAVKEGRIKFAEQFKYLEKYNNFRRGDILLLKCLKREECNLEEYTKIISSSSLHRKIIVRHPELTMGKVNQIVGRINENIMNKYFKSTGWKKLEGEVGRNGIDGLFIKKTRDGKIKDVLIVESKYNKSGLQHTHHGQQMTKEWILRKIEELETKFPNNPEYKAITRHIENDNYRALLWNLKEENEKLIISLKKVHDKGGVIKTTEIMGREKMKILYKNNQEIDLQRPKNEFQKRIVEWYKTELENIAKN